MNKLTHSNESNINWKLLYSIAGWSIIVSIVMIPVSIIAFIIAPMPESTMELFELFQENALKGFLAFDLIYAIINIFAIPVFLALYLSLRKTNPSMMLIFTVIGLFAIIALFASRPILEMYSLSQKYFTEGDPILKTTYLAAGESLFSQFEGTMFHFHYVAGAVALIVISTIMLKSQIYSKLTAITGIAANILVLGLYIPEIGIILSVLSVFPFLTLWYVLVAVTFFRLAK